MNRVSILVSIGLLCTGAAAGQENVDRRPPSIADVIGQAENAVAGEPGQEGAGFMPAVWCQAVDDEETRTECWAAYRANLAYYTTGLDHRARVFAWQHLSTRIIFFVVLFLVLAGVYFAWVQFHHDMRGAGVRDDAQPPESHEVELSASGLKVSSPVLGVVILALSLGFFYLYLVYVYPITEIL